MKTIQQVKPRIWDFNERRLIIVQTLTYGKAKIEVPAKFNLQDTQRNQMFRPNF